jgi:hypothetical protein
MLAEGFSHETLDPVTLDGPPGHLAGHGEAKPGVRDGRRACKHREAGISAAPRGFEHPREICGRQQTLRRREALRARRGDRGLPGDRGPQAGTQTERRARPLARLRDSTSRPFLVAMRARKPWVRLRRRVLG